MSYSLTVRDTVDHIHNWLGGEVSTRSHVSILQGILSAYRELTTWRKWTYLYRTYRVMLHGDLTSGTVSYTSSTRKLNISGNTWPSWAKYGEVRIDDVVANVEERTSSTTLTMDDTVTFSDDIASTSSFALTHSVYLMPEDFQTADEILNTDTWWNATYVQPRDWLANERLISSTGTPTIWTIMGHRSEINRMALYLDPAPSSDGTIDFIIQRKPREMTISGYESSHYDGTVSKGGDDTTVIGSGTSFSSNMVGSVIRIASDNNNIPGPRLGPHPYWEESRISAVNSTTNITIEDSISASYSTKKYVVSDPIDIDPGMTEAFLRAAERAVGIQRRAGNLPELDVLYRQALYTAEANDSKTMAPRVVGWGQSRFRRLSSYPQGDDES